MRCFTISKRHKKKQHSPRPGPTKPDGTLYPSPDGASKRGDEATDELIQKAEERDAKRDPSAPRRGPPPRRKRESGFDRWSRENPSPQKAASEKATEDYPRHPPTRDEQKPGDKRRDEPRPGDKRRDEPRPGDKRRDELRPGDKRRDAPKPTDKRRDEPRHADKRRDGPRPGDKRRHEPKPGDKRRDEPRRESSRPRSDSTNPQTSREKGERRPGMLRAKGGHNRPGPGGDFRDDRSRPAEDTEAGASFVAKAREETARRVKIWLAEGAEMRAARASAPAGSDTALDPWQQDVFDHLVAGNSVIVDAPTTAGKTRAVEAFFRTFLHEPGFRACYTTPVKSLSNDKLREFREMFGSQNVGIATGDIKENLHAPIVVATLESYRNSLLGVEPDLGRTLAVFDEYHYVQDEGRGSAWEEALILTPPSCQVLLLSASVANAEEFTAWMNTLSGNKRQCVLVRTERRPVPLQPLVHYGGAWLLPETLPDNALRNLDKQRLQFPVRQDELADKLKTLVDLELTPTIIYCGRRLACETMAGLLCKHLPPLSQEESERIGASLESSHQEFHALSFIAPRLRQMLQVYGVGFHHSGLAAPARMAIEQLVKHGYLRFCTATMGLSLGINFSVRSALIADYQRPGESGFTDYSPSEVLQMLGRAGRRGKDVVGFSLWSTPEALSRLGKTQRDKVESRLRNDPTTFLGLIGRGFSLAAIEGFYAKSFRRYQDRKVDLTLITKPWLEKKLDANDLPCVSPAAEATRFWHEDPESKCGPCPHRPKCHDILESKTSGSLAALHLHLHSIGALTREEELTPYGSIARYFPQAGGLLLARMIADGEVTPETLNRTLELCAALALARFKEPGVQGAYRLPFNAAEIDEKLEALYPHELFEEIYDPPFKSREYPVIREFNPAAGFVIREWLNGMPWKDLVGVVTTEQYGTGDMMALLYRSATYLQSMIQADLKDLKPMARTLRELILREPLSYALSI